MFSRMLLAACAVLALTASAFAKSGSAVSTVNLRAEANTTSEVLGKIPAGGRIDVGECKDGWCAVTFGGKSGFAIATALDTMGRVRQARAAGDATVVHGDAPPGYVRVPGPGGAYPAGPYAYAPGPYYYGPGPYWGGYWGPRWGYGWRRW